MIRQKENLELYSGIQFLKENKIAFNFLRKQMTSENNNVFLYSLTSELKPLEKTNVGLELAGGSQNGESGGAYRININSQFSKFALSSNYFYTGHKFPGYYSNATFYTGSLNYQATDWLSLGINARRDFSNAELDTLFSTAPYSRQYQALANFKIGDRMFLKAYYSNSERKDRMDIPKFHYKTTSMNANVSHRMNTLSYRISGAYGKSINYLLPKDSRQKKYIQGSRELII